MVRKACDGEAKTQDTAKTTFKFSTKAACTLCINSSNRLDSKRNHRRYRPWRSLRWILCKTDQKIIDFKGKFVFNNENQIN
jgi:hypothetical protein